MSKYEPLTAFLVAKHGLKARMTFAEIESVLGRKLPVKSKAVRAWWSNNPSNNVMTKAWLAAGYRTAEVDIAGEMLSFVPQAAEGFGEMKQAEFEPPKAQPADQGEQKEPKHHPAYGALKGMITILPGVDLTEPAFEDWKELYGEE